MPDAHTHYDLEAQLEELAAAVMGPKKSEFAGGGRHDNQGLVHKVEDLYRTTEAILNKMNNGGIRIQLPPSVWVAIITAVGGLLVQLVVTLGESPMP